MTDREEYDAWLESHFDRSRVPRVSAEFGFEAWVSGRRALVAASGAPVEIRTIPEVSI
jgi:hypothetical protein